MAKGGSGKTAEQDAQDRRAARMRKQRGHGGVKTVTQKAPSLVDIVAERRRREHFVSVQNANVERAIEQAVATIDKIGIFSISRNDQNGGLIIRGLKDRYRKTAVQWNDDGTVVSFARQKKVA